MKKNNRTKFNDADFFFNQCLLADEKGYALQSFGYAQRAFELKPSNSSFRLEFAKKLHESGQYLRSSDLILPCLKRFDKRNDCLTELILLLALNCTEIGDLQAAHYYRDLSCDELLDDEEDFSLDRPTMALYEEIGFYQAYPISKADTKRFFEIGSRLVEEGEYERAEAIFSNLAQHSGDKVTALAGLLKVKGALLSPDAEDLAQKLLDLDENNPQALCFLCFSSYKCGDKKLNEIYVGRLLKLQNTDIETQLQIAGTIMSVSQPVLALDLIKRMLVNYPTNEKLLMYLASCQQMLGNVSQMRAAAYQALTINGSSISAKYAIAVSEGLTKEESINRFIAKRLDEFLVSLNTKNWNFDDLAELLTIAELKQVQNIIDKIGLMNTESACNCLKQVLLSCRVQSPAIKAHSLFTLLCLGMSGRFYYTCGMLFDSVTIPPHENAANLNALRIALSRVAVELVLEKGWVKRLIQLFSLLDETLTSGLNSFQIAAAAVRKSQLNGFSEHEICRVFDIKYDELVSASEQIWQGDY